MFVIVCMCVHACLSVCVVYSGVNALIPCGADTVMYSG